MNNFVQFLVTHPADLPKDQFIEKIVKNYFKSYPDLAKEFLQFSKSKMLKIETENLRFTPAKVVQSKKKTVFPAFEKNSNFPAHFSSESGNPLAPLAEKAYILLTGSKDKLIHMWDVQNGKFLSLGTVKPVIDIVASPAGSDFLANMNNECGQLFNFDLKSEKTLVSPVDRVIITKRDIFFLVPGLIFLFVVESRFERFALFA